MKYELEEANTAMKATREQARALLGVCYVIQILFLFVICTKGRQEEIQRRYADRGDDSIVCHVP